MADEGYKQKTSEVCKKNTLMRDTRQYKHSTQTHTHTHTKSAQRVMAHTQTHTHTYIHVCTHARKYRLTHACTHTLRDSRNLASNSMESPVYSMSTNILIKTLIRWAEATLCFSNRERCNSAPFGIERGGRECNGL